MPIYEYECTCCGRITEAWQRFSEDPLTCCEHCKGELKKLISQSSFHLKGTGWYATDYARKSSSYSPPGPTKPSAGKDSGESANKSDSGSKKTDSSD
ncbi:MAG: zinc ribbon domain-containing protein [Deltaproteobacteria bacterium]|nr:zinc ribbon domain-containing protein [Deltaproteobacteria bacterium]